MVFCGHLAWPRFSSQVLLTHLSMPRPSSVAGSASRGARAPLHLIVIVANRDGRKRTRALDVPIPACMWVRSTTPDQQAGARRHDAGRRDAFGSWQRMRGAGSEEMCMTPSGENQPPRLRMRRLRALDWFAVQPAARCRWRCGNVVAVDARRIGRYAGWFFKHRTVNVSLRNQPARRAVVLSTLQPRLVFAKTHRS